DSEKLAQFTRGRSDVDASGAMNGLMLHLLLTQTKAADEPAPESDNWRDKWVPIISQELADRWAAMAGGDATTRGRHTLDGSTRFYALGIESSGDLLERNTNLVT